RLTGAHWAPQKTGSFVTSPSKRTRSNAVPLGSRIDAQTVKLAPCLSLAALDSGHGLNVPLRTIRVSGLYSLPSLSSIDGSIRWRVSANEPRFSNFAATEYGTVFFCFAARAKSLKSEMLPLRTFRTVTPTFVGFVFFAP